MIFCTDRNDNAPIPSGLVAFRQNTVKDELQKLFLDEEEAVIQLALESTEFDLERAKLILSSSQEREESFSTVKNLSLR